MKNKKIEALIELAKLDAEIEFKQDVIGANEARLTATIETQNQMLQTQELMIAHLKELNIKLITQKNDNN